MPQVTTKIDDCANSAKRSIRVVTSHPANQVVVYSIAKQLMLQGCLIAHLASVYYDPKKLRYGLWQRIPGPIGRRIDRELRKRCSAGLPTTIVRDGPWIELGLAALSRTPCLRRPAQDHRLYRVIDWFHDHRAARWIRGESGIDVVIAFQGSALNTLMAARATKRTAVLMATHPLDHWHIVSSEYAQFGRHVSAETPRRFLQEVSTADYLVSASTSTTRALQACGVSIDRIKEIPYGIDTSSPTFWRTTAISNRPTHFLFVGKLSLHKGLHVLRDAFQAITDADVRLTLVGRAVGEVERRLLREWRDPRVQVIEELDDITDAYSSADAFVFPSLVEGFGMVTLEAMAAGLPIIVTNRCNSVVRDGVDGYVVPAGSRQVLFDRMSRLAKFPAERIRLGQNAQQRSHEFTWERFGKALSEWLLEITGKDHCPDLGVRVKATQTKGESSRDFGRDEGRF